MLAITPAGRELIDRALNMLRSVALPLKGGCEQEEQRSARTRATD